MQSSLSFLIASALALCVAGAQGTAPLDAARGAEHGAERRYIGWHFAVFGEPSFTAPVEERFNPQEVALVEARGDGWGLIETYRGLRWTYLKGDYQYIDRSSSLFDEKEGRETAGELKPQVVRVLERDGDWLLIDTWLGEKWLDAGALRQSVLLDAPAYDQRSLGYPSGCEIVSLAMMINYETEADVHALVREMPRSGDPYLGFRGSPKESNGFTVFPSALTELTEKYLGRATDMSGCDMEGLKTQLNRNRPVVVWINGFGWNVHAVCLTGYDEKGFFFNDPSGGRKNRFVTYSGFYAAWNNPIIDEHNGFAYPPRFALSY